MQAHPSKLDGREAEVAELVERGASNVEIAARFDVSEAAVRRYKARSDSAAPVDTLTADIDDPLELPVIVRDYSHLPSMFVYPLGDVHIGAPKHHARRWQQWVDYLTGQPNRSMIGTGDFLNSALKDSKSEAYDETHTVGKAKRQLRGQLAELAQSGRLDVMIPGNHEARIYRAVGDCPIEDITDALTVPYARSAVLMVYLVGDVQYEIFLRHGTGNGQSLVALDKGEKIVPLADVQVSAHTHRQAITTSEYFVREGDRMVRRRRYKVNAGSFVGWEHYAAEAGYAPTRIGAPRIYLDGRQRDVHCSL